MVKVIIMCKTNVKYAKDIVYQMYVIQINNISFGMILVNRKYGGK
jgi:hypothetical protein